MSDECPITENDVHRCIHGARPHFEYEWVPTGRHACYDERERGRWSFRYDCVTPFDCAEDERKRLMGRARQA